MGYTWLTTCKADMKLHQNYWIWANGLFTAKPTIQAWVKQLGNAYYNLEFSNFNQRFRDSTQKSNTNLTLKIHVLLLNRHTAWHSIGSSKRLTNFSRLFWCISEWLKIISDGMAHQFSEKGRIGRLNLVNKWKPMSSFPKMMIYNRD